LGEFDSALHVVPAAARSWFLREPDMNSRKPQK